MWQYWLVFFWVAFLAISTAECKKYTDCGSANDVDRRMWFSSYVILVFFIGLRHQVGGDWFTYIDILSSYYDDGAISKFQYWVADPLFSLINEFAVLVAGDIHLVNLVCAAIFCWGLLNFSSDGPRRWLTLTISIPYLVTVVAMGYTRQSVAIGVAMAGMISLSRGSIVRYIFWITIAALFHKSAVVLIPIAALSCTTKRFYTLLWVSVTAVVLYAMVLQESMDFLIYGYISLEQKSSGAEVRVLMNAFAAILFLIYRHKLPISDTERSLWFWMSITALLLVIALWISPSSTAVDRVALYWIPLQLYVLTCLPDMLGKRSRTKVMWSRVVVAYSAVVHFVWLFYADTASAWVPYQFYPWILVSNNSI